MDTGLILRVNVEVKELHFIMIFDDIGVVGSSTYKLLPRKTASNRFNMDLYVFIRGGLALRFKNGEERAVRYVPFYVSKKIED